MVYPKSKPKVEKDLFMANVINTEYSPSSTKHLVRFSSSSGSMDIEVITTSHSSDLGNWLKEASGKNVFGFCVKPEIEEAGGHSIAIYYGKKCGIFRSLGSQLPVNLQNFMNNPNFRFYGTNMVKDKIRATFREIYEIELQNNFHFLNPQDIISRFRNVEDPIKYGYINTLKQRVDDHKWGTPALPEQHISYMAVECNFVYSLVI